MKECPLKIENCEDCRWNFGRRCSLFESTTELTVISEEMKKMNALLERILALLEKE
jgi:hypothetical protein